MKKTGIELIAKERHEQIEKHGKTIDFDIEFNGDYQLSEAAAKLCQKELDVCDYTEPKEWSEEVWEKMVDKSYRDRLVISGALIAAEIDRIQALNQE